MPCWELFEHQDQTYRDEVIPPDVIARVAVEKGSILGWTRYTGLRGHVIGMRTFGASAPLKELQRRYGFVPENVVAVARKQVEKARAARLLET
jgi:transketolase